MSTHDHSMHTGREHEEPGEHGPSGHGHDEHSGHRHHQQQSGHDHHERSDHHQQGGHDHQAHHEHGDHVAQFRRLFWIMLALAVPTVALSPAFGHLLGYAPPSGTAWIPAVLGVVIYAWGGRPFLTGAVSELRSRAPGMMLLIGMAITVAFLASAGATLGLLPHDLEFWWELALLVVIMLLGHWIEMRSLAQTSSALDSLASLLPDEAERVDHGGEIVTVAPGELTQGDIVVVRPGGRIPADGEIIDGRAHLDESMITGESAPVARGEGETVVAGTVATDSGLRVQITAVGEQTALAGIQRMVAEAQSTSTKVQRLADRAAGWLFWFALGAAVLTAVVWLALGSPDQALIRVITVLVIACPHALGLAIPLVVSISTERAARAGILVKDRLALERARTIDTVLFDKTGTLTKGEPAVQHVAGDDSDEVLRLAAAAEADSEHPLARAIVRAAEHLTLPPASGFSSEPAVGVRAQIDGQEVRVGGPALLTQLGADALPETVAWAERGHTVLHVSREGTVIGALALADEIRSESRQAVADLRAEGVRVVMITGDAEPVAQAVAEELGIDQVFAQVRPEHKNARVRQLQDEGRVVAMVGDGVNDAPALAQADVGIAIGAGTDVAAASAGVILAGDDPRSVLQVVRLSTASYRIMVQNLWWASGYNLIAVPLAAGVLAPIGFVMPMAVGALLMSASTVVVALNALRLRRVDLRA
ncbi:heavy metal translocating P-type ATPase [Ruania alkalisoli]|nr:heavy metal translocating P-type ATPase [Ruania alkalisoli]